MLTQNSREVRVTVPQSAGIMSVSLGGTGLENDCFSVGNLSRNGLFVVGSSSLDHGSTVDLTIDSKLLKVPLKAQCEVRWARQHQFGEKLVGAGLKISELSNYDRDSYFKLIESYIEGLTVKDLMKTAVVSVDWQASLEQIGAALAASKCDFAFVKRTEDQDIYQVAGEVIWRQLAIARIPGSLLAADLNPIKVRALSQSDTLLQCFSIMAAWPYLHYPVLDEYGETVGVIDSTMIVPLWHEWRQLNEMRRDRIERERRRVLAHELRTPLSVVQMYVRLLDDADEQAANVIRVTEDRCQSMIEMVDRMLTDCGGPSVFGKLNVQRIRVAAFFERLIEDHKLLSSSKLIELESELEVASDLVITTDPTRLRQILANLLSNAIKYSKSGSGVGTAVKFNANTKLLTFTIADSGPGMSEGEFRRILYSGGRGQARPTAGEATHGYGLAIAATLLEELGGVIELESKPGKGACFTVTVPTEPSF